jgi:hypothetical protein
MGSVKSILIGWGKSWGILASTEAEQKLSELRLSICVKCPFHSTSKVLQIINGHGVYEKEIKCDKCGCPCKQKSLVVSESCPVKLW